MKIGYLSTVNFESEQNLKKINSLGNFKWFKLDKTKNKKLNYKNLQNYEILIVSPDAVDFYGNDFFESLPNLKYVTTVTAGFEYIDTKNAKKHKVTVSNCVGANSQSVAEHVFGMFLGLSKRINQFDRDIREKGIYKYDNYIGNELYQKTLGIIGFGEIGKRVAKISKGFDMKVLAYNRSKKPFKNIKYVDLDILLGQSDYIAVCIPLNEKTKCLLNKNNLSKIKDGCYLVSITRDEVIETTAIIQMLRSKKLSGFGLDGTVYTPIDKRLLKFDNVIANAHNGFNTFEANDKIEKSAIINVESFIKSKPINIVN